MMAVLERLVSGLLQGAVIGFVGSLIVCTFWLRSITKEVREQLAAARDEAFQAAKRRIENGEDVDGTGG